MTQTLKDFNPKTVTIGAQEWMQENLAVNDGGEGIYYNEKNKQYYYTWDAAMRITESIPGWHLPSAEEWNTAAETCGAEVVGNGYKDDPYMRDYDNTKKLYDTLRVLPVGCYDDGSLYNVGSYAFFGLLLRTVVTTHTPGTLIRVILCTSTWTTRATGSRFV